MQCVNVLIRKQWTDNERLTYPLVRLPLEITDAQPGGRGRSGLPLTQNRLFWLGFVLAAGIDLTNSLNYYFPDHPAHPDARQRAKLAGPGPVPDRPSPGTPSAGPRPRSTRS